MCAQCWATAGTAATAVGGAAGLRAWAASGRPRWLSDGRLRALTVVLFAVAVLVAGVRLA